MKGDRIIRKIAGHSILNVMYHGVVQKNSNYFSPRHITKEQFEKQLRYFTGEFDIISLSEAFEYKRNGFKPKRKTITISFDDGYVNNLHTALPILEKYNIKTTFFISGICTEEVEIRALWADILACLMLTHRNDVIEYEDKKFDHFIEVDSKISLSDFVKSCEPGDRYRFLYYLISKYDLKNEIKRIPEEIWKILDKEELVELSHSHIVDIGSHGYGHFNLANINIADARKEIESSKTALQEVVNKEIIGIAFPDGSYNDEIKDLTEQAGYRYQMAVDYRLSSDKNDLRILNRHGISSTTTFDANILLLNYAFKSKGYN
jgi:peptidoglycan/xylan/chitin deacetylase (PgdA/CDA1 family)